MEANEITSRLHEAIQEAIEALEEDDVESTVVSGWVILVETAHEDDIRTMRVLSGDATGQLRLPYWTVEGWLHHTAHNYDLYEDLADEE